MGLWSPVELRGRGEVVGDGDPRDGPAAHLREELVRVEGEADGDQTAASPAERRGGLAEEIILLLGMVSSSWYRLLSKGMERRRMLKYGLSEII